MSASRKAACSSASVVGDDPLRRSREAQGQRRGEACGGEELRRRIEPSGSLGEGREVGCR
jgi:hypothetical protein